MEETKSPRQTWLSLLKPLEESFTIAEIMRTNPAYTHEGNALALVLAVMLGVCLYLAVILNGK